MEKLATPDVTIADMIGDIDPIKAARRGQDISDELTVHYGLLPRANRGIFAINELPDLAGKIQVGLFNIMQEGDVQIKGYPVRLPLDLMLVFTANPEDYTARGKIITPLKDRIGSEIRTHYPATLDQGMAITEQEAWLERASRPSKCACRSTSRRSWSSWRSWRARTSASTSARASRSACPFRCWRTWCRTPSGARLKTREPVAVPRVLDIYSALPSITGKMELEYEGELKGGDAVARELIRVAVGKVYDKYFEGANVSQIVQWFDLGGTLKLDESVDSAAMVQAAGRHPGPDGKAQGAEAFAPTSRMPCARRPRNSCWRACTRTGASAATRSAASARRSATREGPRRRRAAAAPATSGRQYN